MTTNTPAGSDAEALANAVDELFAAALCFKRLHNFGEKKFRDDVAETLSKLLAARSLPVGARHEPNGSICGQQNAKSEPEAALSSVNGPQTADFAAPQAPAAPGMRLVPVEPGGVAKQIHDMGLKVGDTITGRESGNGYGGYWHEAKLTLLWVGQCEAVWLESERSDNNPEWSEPEETTAWTLDAREWVKLSAIPADTGTVVEGHPLSEGRCPYCDGSGDVHTPTGEWRGRCNCEVDK